MQSFRFFKPCTDRKEAWPEEWSQYATERRLTRKKFLISFLITTQTRPRYFPHNWGFNNFKKIFLNWINIVELKFICFIFMPFPILCVYRVPSLNHRFHCNKTCEYNRFLWSRLLIGRKYTCIPHADIRCIFRKEITVIRFLCLIRIWWWHLLELNGQKQQ